MSASSFIRTESTRLNIRLSPRLTQDEQLTRVLDAMYPGSTPQMTQQRVEAMKAHFSPRRATTTPAQTPRAPTKAAALPSANDYQVFAAEFLDHWEQGMSANEWTEEAMDIWMSRWPASSRTYSRDFFEAFSRSIVAQTKKAATGFLWSHFTTWFDSFLDGVRDQSHRGRPAADIYQQATNEWATEAAKQLQRRTHNPSFESSFQEVQTWLQRTTPSEA